MSAEERIIYESIYKASLYDALGLSFTGGRTSVPAEQHEKLKNHPLYGIEFAKVGELKYKRGTNVPFIRIERNDKGQEQAVIEQVRTEKHPHLRDKIEVVKVGYKPQQEEQELERRKVVDEHIGEIDESDIDKLFE